MPSRVIREGWVESERIDQLDGESERFFLRLCLRADDFGRYHGNHSLLRSSLFPLKLDVRITDIPRWLAACEKAGLLRCYSIDSKSFVEILRFDQRLRAKVSKFPPPPPTDAGRTPDICPSHDRHMRTEGESESEVEMDLETESETEAKSPLRTPRPAEAGPTPPAKTVPIETDEQWLANLSLSHAFAGIDVPREHAKATLWCQTNRKQLSRRRFLNWLNRCDKPMVATQNGSHAANGRNPHQRLAPTAEDHLRDGFK